ncbi:carbohydrate ABC transporter permease [Cohnella thailandensis]|uniref:Carbohydrate ABC transporter permease n=1 Tax=Cohnella thailandensis TaxID=557557 RepID=A0A841SZU4_9BACL|nr:carbohydrate ABC transporter permease [Cohnella thailandensis]MBB6635775.1 carbohydrate ABC transporter permease [Cohnella thailandensis]MBP1976153.1 putative aldouronate transport system permease protein [Cohnella thailandensis]
MPAQKGFRWSTLFIHLFFVCLTLSMLIPLALIIIVSLTDEQSILHHGFRVIPDKLSTTAYHYFLKTPDTLLRAYGVTILVSVIGTTLSLILTSTMGYTLSRRDYGLNRVTSFYVFFTMLFNGGLVPFYILMTRGLQVKDTLWAMIIPGLLSPFYVLIMKGFMSKIPYEIIESAKVEGAREWRIYAQLILPLSKPALATLGLFIMFNFWNEWFNALLFIDNQKLVPLQLLLVRTMNSLDFITSRPEFSAAMVSFDMSKFPSTSAKFAIAIMSAGPMLLVFPFFQRFFVKGLTVGAIKG